MSIGAFIEIALGDIGMIFSYFAGNEFSIDR